MASALRESDDGLLRRCLEQGLSETRDATVEVAELERRRFAYETSFAIDELDVVLADGKRLRLLVKDVGAAGLSAAARSAKPPALLEPRREIVVYRDLLAVGDLSTPRFHGASCEPDEGRWWLFLERVDGEVLTDVGELEIWQEAARWSARAQAVVASSHPPPLERLLVHRDTSWHARWVDAALAALTASPSDGAASGRLGERLRACRGPLIERLDALPPTFVHGELYASNVIVERRSAGPPRIAPVDWELAGSGPYALDLASLVTGWEGEGQLSICRAFYEALAEDRRAGLSLEQLLDDVDLCGLALALQWIGWAPGWEAPEAHRRDWVAEAERLLAEVVPR